MYFYFYKSLGLVWNFNMDACGHRWQVAVPSVRIILEKPGVIWGWGKSITNSFPTVPTIPPIVHPSSSETCCTPGSRPFDVIWTHSNTAAAASEASLLPAGSIARQHVCHSSCPLTESLPSAPRVKIPPGVHAHPAIPRAAGEIVPYTARCCLAGRCC